MIEYFDAILRMEEMFGRHASGLLSLFEAKRSVACALEEVVENLCEPNMLIEFGWSRSSPRCYGDSVGSAYAVTWTDECSSRIFSYDATIGMPYRRLGRRLRPDPQFSEYKLSVHQVSLRNGEVMCGLELEVFEQHFDGARIRVRHFEIFERFPGEVRRAIVGQDDCSDQFEPDDYPLSSLLILFDAVLEQVVSEREKRH